jgi:hypothetical protein
MTMRRVLSNGFQRQRPTQECVEQAMLGQLDLFPRREIGLAGQIGDDAVVTACHAKLVVGSSGHEPVAGVRARIRAKNRCSAGKASGFHVLLSVGCIADSVDSSGRQANRCPHWPHVLFSKYSTLPQPWHLNNFIWLYSNVDWLGVKKKAVEGNFICSLVLRAVRDAVPTPAF